MFWNSIFDQPEETTEKNRGLWNKLDGKSSSIQSTEQVIFEGHLLKTDAIKHQREERYFVLTADRLYIQKTKDGRLKGYMDVRFTRFFAGAALDSKQEDITPTNKLSIRFMRDLRYSDLVAKNQEELELWLNALAGVMICTDFEASYRVASVLGEGSFGKVYRAKNIRSGNTVAVKAFNKDEIRNNPKGPQSLAVEIEVLYKLHHNNLMSLYQVYESKNSVYLVCEYIPGESLSSLLEKSKDFLSIEQIKSITKGVLTALAHLESLGIVHRDIKPSNIMFADSSLSPDSVKLCDFGLSDLVDRENPLFTKCGTPGFVAPECLGPVDPDEDENRRLSEKCDIFSVGDMTYFLVTGEMPFSGKSPKEILKSTLIGNINYQNPRLSTVPSSLIDLLRELLQSDPNRRLTATFALHHPFYGSDDKDQFGSTGEGSPEIGTRPQSIKTRFISLSKVNCSTRLKESGSNKLSIVKKISNTLKAASLSKARASLRKETSTVNINHNIFRLSSIEIDKRKPSCNFPTVERSPAKASTGAKSTATSLNKLQDMNVNIAGSLNYGNDTFMQSRRSSRASPELKSRRSEVIPKLARSNKYGIKLICTKPRQKMHA
jgi:serine/threonine protein kinase